MYICIIIVLVCLIVFLLLRKRVAKQREELYYCKSVVDGAEDDSEIVREILREMRKGYSRLRSIMIKETSHSQRFNDDLAKQIGWHKGMWLVPLSYRGEALMAVERFVVQKVLNCTEIYDDNDYVQL